MSITKILSISGSPVPDSSTDLLLKEMAVGLMSSLPEDSNWQVEHLRLNDFSGIPCQACGKAPTEDGQFCFYDDEISSLYERLANCDCLLFGSPIHFDAVSSQAKLFIDRCNCFRPADFENHDPEHDFIKRIKRKRPGAMVLVGAENAWFEGARRCIAGWFKWIEVSNEGELIYHSADFTKKKEAAGDELAIQEARNIGHRLAQKIQGNV